MSEILSKFEKHIEVTCNHVLAVDLLALHTPLSKQSLKKIMQKGAVWLTKGNKTQRLRRAKKELRKGEVIHIYYDPHILNQAPLSPTLICDEGAYSLWHKPSGLLSQGSKWGEHCTITRFAEQNLTPERNSFVVHRLDRAANGLILIAHEKNAAAKFSKLFQNRLIEKRYHIWVKGAFKETVTSNLPVTVDSEIDGRSAVSHFSFLHYDAKLDRSLLDVSIDTGRKHQIRRHSALLGFPVIGDRLHGVSDGKEDLQLTAYYLGFICPYTQVKKSFNLHS